MHGQTVVDAVGEQRATELDRLGSDKYLIAATGADLSSGPVLRTVARSAAGGRDVFERWAGAESGDVAAAFADAADREADAYERVVAAADLGEVAADSAGGSEAVRDAADSPEAAVTAALSETDGTVERVAAGLVGRPLVADRTLLQVVSFFVNEADENRAQLARELRSDADARLEAGTALLDSVAESDEDVERAQAAAARVVADAYAAYADALEAMGVDPKPVC
jgi:hypothetical protein